MKAINHVARYIFTVYCLLFSTQSSAILINFNSFTAEPSANVSISFDGLSASFTENPVFSPVSLRHDGLMITTLTEFLSFDYELIVASGNEDYFDFYMGDFSRPFFSVGDVASSAGDQIFSGTYVTDVSPYTDTLLPVVFGFSAGWDDYGIRSTLTVSNLEIQSAQIPEPNSALLLTLGLLVMASGMKYFQVFTRWQATQM